MKQIPIALSVAVALLVALVLLAGGCKKSSTKPPAPPPPPAWTAGTDVYIAGQDSGRAVYWKNGQETVLAANGNATGISLSGTDVYVSGEVVSGLQQTAVYWKNGVQVNLTTTGTATTYQPVVAGGNVYVPGYLEVPSPQDYIAVYWKNGVRIVLDTSVPAMAMGLAVLDTDVYVIGYVFPRSYGGWDTAVVWKNGVQQSSPYSVNGGSFNQILTYGPNVYFVGINGYFVNNGSYSILPGASATTAMTFAGQDVYVAGKWLDSLDRQHAAYWKNGVMTALPDYKNSTESVTSGIVVAGTDVYVIGTTVLHGVYAGIYWKNGVEETLTGLGVLNGAMLGN